MPARIRNWYSVYQIGDAEPSIIVSAFSVTGVKCYLKENLLPYKYKIIPTKNWSFVKVMSGVPYEFGKPITRTLNCWYMNNDGQLYQVVILN